MGDTGRENKGHDQFHAEKDELLTTGIRYSSYIQTDDTGTRHKGQNGYCTIINNESFAWFASTGSKSRENFLSLLHRPWRTYALTENAIAYLEARKYPEKWLRVLRPYLGVTFLSRKAWENCIKEQGLTGKKRFSQASEALIYGSLIEQGAGHLTTFIQGIALWTLQQLLSDYKKMSPLMPCARVLAENQG